MKYYSKEFYRRTHGATIKSTLTVLAYVVFQGIGQLPRVAIKQSGKQQ